MTPVSDFVCIKLFVILIVYMVCIKLLDSRAVVIYHCPRAHRLFSLLQWLRFCRRMSSPLWNL